LINLILSVLLITTAIGLVYYWLDFYLRKGVQVIHEDWYLKFEKAFPVADMWIAACAILGAVGLLTEQNYGLLFSLLAGSSSIFLALMDITFNIENKLYRLVGGSNQMLFELGINFWFLSLGIVLVAVLGFRII
jgi:hypothetical protein